jgi:hypothetical protein
MAEGVNAPSQRGKEARRKERAAGEPKDKIGEKARLIQPAERARIEARIYNLTEHS